MKLKKLIHTAFISLCLGTGCATAPMADKEAEAQAKTFSVKPNKANIYIYRGYFLPNAGWTVPILIDDNKVGELPISAFLVKEVDPGLHVIVGKASTDGEVKIVTEAGRNYFIWIKLAADMGSLFGKVEMEVLDEAHGQAGVSQYGLVK